MQSLEKMSENRTKTRNWNDTLCPKMHELLQKALLTGSTWSISASHENIYEVHSDPSVHIDTALRLCSCGRWQHYGFPCAYATIVLHKTSHIIGKDLMQFIDPYFYVSFYKQAFAGSIHPVTTHGRDECSRSKPTILPPISKKLPGRPKKKKDPI